MGKRKLHASFTAAEIDWITKNFLDKLIRSLSSSVR